jgi:hypothetical protein
MKKRGFKLQEGYLKDPTLFPQDLSNIQVSSWKNLYREMVWLFTRITRQEYTTNISKIGLHIFYFSIHENTIFDLARIIPSELSFQLGNFRKNNKFYMSSYLIFIMTYRHVFNCMSFAKKVNYKFDYVKMRYPVLWKHKVSYHFYEVNNAFIYSFKRKNIVPS